MVFRLWSVCRRCAIRPALGLAVFAGVFSLSAGCMVGPNYVRPKAAQPVAYKEAQGWKPAEPRDHISRGGWWEVFNDPQLNDLEKQVVVSNQTLAAAEAQYQQARAMVQIARAAYFPTVAAGPSYLRSRSSTNNEGSHSTASTLSSTNPVSNFLLSGSASWEPDIWGKVQRSVEAGKETAQATEGTLEATRLSLQGQLAQDYYTLCSLDAQIRLYEKTVEVYRKFLQLTLNRQASGIASSADVLQAETQLKTTQAQAIDLGVQRAQMEHAIAVLMGKPPSDLTIPATVLDGEPPVIPVGLPSELLERRPDIASAERSAAAANEQIGIAIAAYFPTITLSASGGFGASSVTDWFTWPSRLWAIGGTLSETLYDGGLRSAQTAQARAAYDGTVANYRETVLSAFQEVEDDLASIRILEQEAKAQDAAVIAAEKSVTVTINRYKEGIASALDVIVTQTIAFNDERSAIDILGRRMISSVDLVKALGGGWNSTDLPYQEAVRKTENILPNP